MDEMKNIKKYDLHCHLDGSLSIGTMRKLAECIGKELPEDEELTRLLQVTSECQSLKEYLEKFDLPLSCLVTRDSFKAAAENLLKEAAQEGVGYMEIRFAPLLSCRADLPVNEIVEGVLEGVCDGERYGITGKVILCAMRHMGVEQNLQIVDTARRYLGEGVCAIDLAGDEKGFPVLGQKRLFAYASEMGVPYTIHAGECGSVQSIKDAISLGTRRIGHGIAAAKDRELQQYCAKNRICFEMCPISNLQTKAVPSIEDYPIVQFLEMGIPVTINTDNRMVSNTTITKEWELLRENFHLTERDFKTLMENAAQAAFVK